MEGSNASVKSVRMIGENMHTQGYVTVMVESLQKKIMVLDSIIDKNKIQRLILLEEQVDGDSFEQNLEAKSQLIEELEKLDDGFEQLYERVKAVLETDREQYSGQIQEMKRLITEITEKSTQVQVQEQRNRELAEKKFAATKQKIRQVKAGRRVASQYYQNMNNLNNVESQFLDRKK